MVGTKTDEAKPSGVLHVISHFSWEHDWCLPSEMLRARLLDEVAALLHRIDTEKHSHANFFLDGQTLILDEILAVRPDLLALMVIYNATGRLHVGPWYVQVDESLVSGEALIRNLLYGREHATLRGFKLSSVGFGPIVRGHPAQLPQILHGFGVDSIFLWRGAPAPRVPFRWEAPDGSSVLTISHGYHPCQDEDYKKRLKRSVVKQKGGELDGPWLWMHAVTPCEPGAEVDHTLDVAGAAVDVPLLHSSLAQYVDALRNSLPDEFRPALRGELRMHSLEEHNYLLPGTLSTRMYLKQANARLQTQLTYAAEPLLALALTHGKIPAPNNPRALLNHSWRLLLRTQADVALGGCGTDAMHEENEISYRQIEDSSAHVIEQALEALPGQPQSRYAAPPSGPESYIVVWNPHNWPLEQVIEAPLTLGPDVLPQMLSDSDGDEIMFGWLETTTADDAYQGQRKGRLSFLAKTPALGYTSYTLKLSSEPLKELHRTQRSSGNAIVSVFRETLSVEDGQLMWKRGDKDLVDILRFLDGGDAGDAFSYSTPEKDVVEKAHLIDSEVKVESSPLYERLILQHRLRVAPALGPDRNRGRGVKLIELSTEATFYNNMAGVYFQTRFENTVRDHRLRAHVRTGVLADDVLADAAYGFVQRHAVTPGPDFAPLAGQNMEQPVSTYPLHNLCAVSDGEEGMTLLTRGLPEFEAIPEDGQMTLALTLVRAVGWLSRDDLRTRTARVAPMVPMQGAQCQRPMEADYALMPGSLTDRAQLMRMKQAYQAPLRAYQYDKPPEKARHSYLTVSADELVLTALKPPQNGSGWIMRLHNPTDEAVKTHLTTHPRPRSAQIVNFAEEMQQVLAIEEDGRVATSIKPHQVQSLWLAFS